MKSKRHTSQDKIRILREADRGSKSIQAICQEQNISEVSFHRWMRQFGHLDINEARQLKELETGQQRPMALTVMQAELCSGRAACRILRLSRSTYW